MKYTLIYNDQHRHKKISIKHFETLKDVDSFLDSEDFCSEGESINYVLIPYSIDAEVDTKDNT